MGTDTLERLKEQLKVLGLRKTRELSEKIEGSKFNGEEGSILDGDQHTADS